MVLDTLREWLAGHDGGNRRYRVALSGGLDSTVLLHALATLRAQFPAMRLDALHVDHALQDESGDWARHCRALCRRLDVRLKVHRADAIEPAGQGLEAAAREARYRWFSSQLGRGDVLVTAHHAGDQAETILYNLLRGGGLRGLAGMPVERSFSRGVLARPLLALPRAALSEHATANALEWIEDPSNEGLEFDRNYIRHRLVPIITARWPAAERNLQRVANNAAEAAAILERLARRQIAECVVPDALQPLSDAPVLDVPALFRLPEDECLGLLRHWIIDAGYRPPPRDRLLGLRRGLIGDAAGAGGFEWADATIRRYRDALYLVPSLPRRIPGPCKWRLDRALDIPGVPLRLVARRRSGAGIALAAIAGRELTVDFDTGDRRIRLHEGGPRRPLRKLFQEMGIPPWMRRVLPRISLEDELLCVVPVAEAASRRAARGEPGVKFELAPRPVPPIEDADGTPRH